MGQNQGKDNKIVIRERKFLELLSKVFAHSEALSELPGFESNNNYKSNSKLEKRAKNENVLGKKQKLLTEIIQIQTKSSRLEEKELSKALKMKVELQLAGIKRGTYRSCQGCSELNGSLFSEIFEMLISRNMLTIEDIHRLRQVCKEYRTCIDNFFWNEDEDDNLWKRNHSLRFPRSICFPKMSDLGIVFPSGNPFPNQAFTMSFRMLSYLRGSGVFLEDVLAAASTFKDKVTSITLVWTWELVITENKRPVMLEQYVNTAKLFMDAFPLLRKLQIELELDDEERDLSDFAYFYGASYRKVDNEEIKVEELPVLTHLKSLELRLPNVPIVYPSLSVYFNQLETLEVTGGFLRWYWLNAATNKTFPKLRKLKVTSIYSMFELRGLWKLTISTKLKEVAISGITFQADFYRLLEFLEGAGETLEILSVEAVGLLHVMNPRLLGIYDREWRLLHFPKLKELNLTVAERSLSLDALLWISSESFQRLHISWLPSFPTTDDIPTWMKYQITYEDIEDHANVVGKLDEIIDLTGFEERMDQSNIWGLIPSLKEVSVGKGQFLRSRNARNSGSLAHTT